MWRGDYQLPGAPVPPEPWPYRVEAFMTACAMHAGQREADFGEFVKGMGTGLQQMLAAKLAGM